MELALIGFAFVLLLCFLGFPLGFTTLAVGIVGFAYARNFNWEGALTMAGQQVLETGANYGFSVIPLFILMGVFIHRSNISEDLFRAGYALVGHRRGGVAQATVLACAGFSAVSGSSIATTATMSKVALPNMRKYGYDDRLSGGVVAAGGTLGVMIPPSVPLVIYAMVAEQDVGRLFVAAVVPGVLLVILFMVAVSLIVRLDPKLGAPGKRMPVEERRAAYVQVWPIVVLFCTVLGGIYFAVFTPTEAAGIGAMGAALFAVWRGSLRNLGQLWEMLIEAAKTSATLFAVIFGALVFANFINLSGLPFDLLDIVDAANLSPVGVVVALCAICILLGMIFESVGLLLLIVPVFLPTLIAMDVDLIWLGIVIVVVVELGLITPPIGLNIFTVRAVMPDMDLRAIFRGVMPFVYADLVLLALLIAFPTIGIGLLALR